MSPDGRKRGGSRAVEPSDLRHVGPATAAVIERAPFEAGDLPDRTVSFAELLAAGVNPGVAAKLRREYSLVWSFEWVAGAFLARRAEQVGGLDPDQREWIAASPSTGRSNGIDGDVIDAERAWRERAAWVDAVAEGAESCERCGDDLVTFRMGDRRSVQCESCGYVGVSVRSRSPRASDRRRRAGST